MMDYLLLAGTCIAAFHAYTYGRWLKENGNKTGAAGVIILAILGFAVAGYKAFGDK